MFVVKNDILLALLSVNYLYFTAACVCVSMILSVCISEKITIACRDISWKLAVAYRIQVLSVVVDACNS